MKQHKRLLTLFCTVAFGVSAVLLSQHQPARAYEGEAYAIRGATIVTVTGATIAKGNVVVRNGLIEAVGAEAAIPADAKVIDGTGLTVYPGLFDTFTSLGVPAPTTPDAGGGRRGGGAPPADPAQAFLAQMSAPPSTAGLLPEVSVTEQLQVAADTFDQQRSAGITTALTAPRTGIFQGQSALINLGAEPADKLILKAPISLNIGFGSARGGFPNSLMGTFAFLRQSLLDAQHYREEWARYNKSPRGAQRPAVNKSLAALQPVINGEMPVILSANSEREIKRAVALAEEFKLKYMLAGAMQSYLLADFLKAKNVTVLLSLGYPQRPQLDDPEDEALRTLKDRAEAPKAAAALHNAGVRFAFNSGTLTRPADYLANAARAIEAGLPKEAALKALTINAAEIFGVAEQLGSIEKGKIANLVVASGDLFNKDTKIKHVFVDGKPFEIKAVEPARPGGPGGRGGPGGGRGPGGAPNGGAALATGSWELTINAPEGQIQGTLKINQSGSNLSGEITTPFGTAPLKNGVVSGNDVSFGFSLNVQGQQLEVAATAKITGDSISGSFAAEGQSSSFTGTRKPN
ncbi:MAG: amidohydrolase family protein [Acidobacteria bacterium]|nr:amidohydrolase family protein [Acidobacteriota bacterium]MBI3424200.1 amidohydrolase family protein [Acidobacteriota bacterium]